MLPKKPTIVREFIENTFTHYNYYYDANLKLNLVVERAKAFQKDDYTKLLAFYPYTFENTMAQKKDLDSVILKATAGILLHDLRNDWIDNMYFLIGKSYFYKKQFDSAAYTFQFINFNLSPRKHKNDDEDPVIGTVDNASNGVLSIATKEKPNVAQKIASLPPSRNDALIWLIRTLIEQQKYLEAGGIINTLQYDPNMPDRLKDDLEEVDAFLFFQQGNYDSAAVHLEKALSNADNLQDKARWQFLLAQLYELTYQYTKAMDAYNRAAANTTNPLLDIFADLNMAKMLKNQDSAHLDDGIKNLLHMSTRYKYENYQDIIYYSAGQLAMEKPDTTAAITYYTKSLSLHHTDAVYKDKALVDLGDIAFNRKQYGEAYAYYDSLQATDSMGDEKYVRALERTKNLIKISTDLAIINREDSLQQLAAMSPEDRSAAVKKVLKQLRKAQGLKNKAAYYDDQSGSSDIGFSSSSKQPTDLFGTSDQGDWYFYNAAIKAKGYNDFKSRWGDRTNADNWSRKSASANTFATNALNPDDTTSLQVGSSDTTQKAAPVDISYKGLMANIPLTSGQMDQSNGLLSRNLFRLGKLYQNNLEDYRNAIATYERSLRLFPDSLYMGDIYFDLYYCYHKLGDTTKMAFYKDLLVTALPDSRSAELLTDPDRARPLTDNAVVAARYSHIYDLYIAGEFDSAITEKNNADTLYGQNYWSPQLMYIEAIYYIKYKCDDSSAIKDLQHIVSFYRRSPLVPQAQNLINVLRRRKEIEDYLTNLQVTRATEDQTVSIPDDTVATASPVIKPIDSSIKKIAPPVVVKDSVKKVAPVVPVNANQFSFNESSPHHIIMVMTKVDGTYASEARNAFLRYNDEMFYEKQYTIDKVSLDADHIILIISPFANADIAMQYFNKINVAAPNEISWLEPNKYYFEIISDESLQLLEKNKDLTGYKNLLKIKYPGKF
ncbi:MAG TPA: tetratricopeptide repeat protein [Ferruginibacter sp.]|nr:tetratricopeptide repeat protein [Ferruginibacter sp.]